MRLGEVSRLRFEDLDIENGMVTVRPFRSSKKSRPRQIPLGKGKVTKKELWKYVANLEEPNPEELVFNLTKRGIQSMLYRVKKRTGNSKIHARRFTHFCHSIP